MRLRPDPKPAQSPFDLSRELLDLGNGVSFTIADACAGVAVTGASGSGKTTGPGSLFATTYLSSGMGGVALCAKVGERALWEGWAKESGRERELIIVKPDGPWRFNFMNWAASRGDQGCGYALDVVACLADIAAAIGAEGATGEGGGDNAFFRSALNNLLINLVALAILARLSVSMRLLRSVANSAPLSLAQLDDPEWRRASACWQILREAEAASESDPEDRQDFEECRRYFEQDFPALSDRTRSIIMVMFGTLVRPFITRPLRKLFCEDTTVTPEDTFDGKIIIVDLPVQDFRQVGRVAALTWKWCFQLAVMRRRVGAEPVRPVFLWADEAQNFITPSDAEYQAVARSGGGCTVYLTQQREGIRRVLRSDDATENLLANLNTKIFCQNTGETNTWAADLIGERYVKITSTNIGRSAQIGTEPGIADASSQAGIQRSDQRRHFVEPACFTTLTRGGAGNNMLVEAVVYVGGKLFPSRSGEPLPYRIVTFRQR